MYNQPYFIPGHFTFFGPNIMRGAMNGAMGRTMGSGVMGSGINGARLATGGFGRSLGIFSRLGNSMKAIKGVNWGSLITNTSKTLNVVNQTIPLVRQVGPMMNNMKSLLRIASIFKDETDIKPMAKFKQNNNSNNNNIYTNNIINSNKSTLPEDTNIDANYNHYDNSPTFFINS